MNDDDKTKLSIFGKNKLAGIELQNRIIRAATHEGMADENGFPGPELAELYIRLARGGIGAIITGYAGVHRDGKPLKNMLMIDDDRLIDAYRKINRTLEEYGVPLIMQVAHGGGKSDPAVTGTEAAAPSGLRYSMPPNVPRELTDEEIWRIIGYFTSGIERAKKSGFAGAELHAAHGYLLSQFLSPAMNRRKDSWGGSTENRFRIIAEIMRGVRDKCGDFPVLMKFSAYDGDRHGVRMEEGVKIAKLFEEAGGNAVEVSCGGVNDGAYPMRFPQPPADAIIKLTPALKEKSRLKKVIIKKAISMTFKSPEPLYNYNAEAAKEVKKHLRIPVIAVGGIREMEMIERIIHEGYADYVSLSRPLIIEPDLAGKFRRGEQNTSRCINCGICLIGAASSHLKCYYGKVK